MGIPSMMICDTMVGSLFSHPNPEHKIHAVAVGADRVVLNGDTANKIGTYQAAVLAQRHGIPFIVVAPISTIDLDVEHGNGIPIEMRPSIECVKFLLPPSISDLFSDFVGHVLSGGLCTPTKERKSKLW